jgi:carbonic anhydrase
MAVDTGGAARQCSAAWNAGAAWKGAAMSKLFHGIHTFRKQVFPHRKDHFEQLANGQTPATLFITCSDSRIVPELLTQTDPGELFVLRNAGNLVPPYSVGLGGEAATIEYAVNVLKVQEIVVCGHSHCGAIMGLMRPETLKNLPCVENWLQFASQARQEILEKVDERQPACDMLMAAIKCNTLVQLGHLRTYPAVAAALERGQLTLHAWYYRFETGEVLVYDDTTDKFASYETALESEVLTASVA